MSPLMFIRAWKSVGRFTQGSAALALGYHLSGLQPCPYGVTTARKKFARAAGTESAKNAPLAPTSGTFGSVVAHILTGSVVRRQTVIGVLRELGVPDAETRDPIEWEREVAARG